MSNISALRVLTAGAAAAFLALAVPAAAHADPWGRERGHHGHHRHHHDDRHDRGWGGGRGAYYGYGAPVVVMPPRPRVMYPPAVIYQQPPVVYAPPPVVYAPPRPAGVDIGVYLPFR